MSNEVVTYQGTENVVVYSSADNAVHLDVQLADETVWLTQQQIATLFGVQIPALDAILSVGYRVNSANATRFRQWATRVLRDYLLRGYAVNPHLRYLEQRIDDKLQEHTEQIHELQNKVDFFIRTSLPPREGIFVDGQIYDAYEFVERLIKSAQKSILLIDNYVDESVLTMMSRKQEGVQVDIYTKDISNALQLAEKNFNAQYKDLALHTTSTCHDRFMIIDDETIYLIGASLKDAGKRLFAFTQMNAEQIKTIKARL